MTKGGGGPFGFAKSKAKMLPLKNKIMFYENEMKHYLETQTINYFIDNSC